MKKIIFLLLFALPMFVNGQVTLENIYPNTIGSSKFLLLSQIDSEEYKYILFDPQNSQFTIYNLNHSVYLNVDIPITYVAGSSQYQIAYVSKSLFDCDDSNIEYALSFLGDGMPNSYPKRFSIYRTNGEQVQSVDSVCFVNFSDGWKYGPKYNKPIVSTPLGTKLILRHLDGSTRIYSVCGEFLSITTEMNEENLLGNAYPNPSQNFITIPYKLPSNENKGTLIIYDLSGKELNSYVVDNTFTSITLTTSELSSGTYFYKLITAKGQSGTKKMIKVE